MIGMTALQMDPKTRMGAIAATADLPDATDIRMRIGDRVVNLETGEVLQLVRVGVLAVWAPMLLGGFDITAPLKIAYQDKTGTPGDVNVTKPHVRFAFDAGDASVILTYPAGFLTNSTVGLATLIGGAADGTLLNITRVHVDAGANTVTVYGNAAATAATNAEIVLFG